MPFSNESIVSLRKAAHEKLSGAYAILSDLHVETGVMSSREALLMLALMDSLEQEDRTCSVVDLIAPDYQDNELNQVQASNRKTLENFAKWFVEE